MPSDVLITPASSKVEFTDGSNATKTLRITGTSFSFDSDLGIGITSPTSKLNVLSTTSLSSVFKAEGVNGTLFEVTDDLSNSLMSVNTIGGLPVFEVFANNTIIAGQYGANDFVINGNKVGIGLASPSYKLQVSGSSGDQAKIGDIIFGSTVAGSNSITAATSFGSNGNLVINASGQTNQLWLISSSGNVGFGTFSPANKIAVIGSASVGSNYNTAAPTNGLIVEGSVGIGTTNPAAKLAIGANPTYAAGVTLIVGTPGNPSSSGTSQPYANLRLGTNTGNSQVLDFGIYDASPYGSWIQASGGGNLAFPSPLVLNPTGGNVGIGVSNPTALLTIYNTAFDNNTDGFKFGYSSGYHHSFSAAFNSSASLNNLGININNGFNTGRTRVLTLLGDGNVGIGTTTIGSRFVVNGGTVNTTTYTTSEARISDASLHLMKTVAGGIFESIRAMNADTTAGTTVRFIAASTSDPFNNTNGGKVFIDAIRTSTNMDLAFSLNDVAGAAPVERVRFMGSGNVGIGTTNPISPLEIYKVPATSTTLQTMLTINTDFASASGTGFGGSITFKGRTAGNELQDNAQISAYNENTGDNGYALGFYTRPTVAGGLIQRMTILRGGNVGIGTNNPAAKLDLYNGSDLGSGANGIRVQRPGAYGQYGYLEYLVSSDATILGSVYTGGGASGYGRIFFRQHSSNASRDAMVINTDGNVGIGTTNPAYKLDVNGTCNVSDYLTIKKDLGFPISNTSAYFGYSVAVSSSAGSLLELVHSLSGSIGVNDPLRFRSILSAQESNDGVTYTTEVGPPSYSRLIDGNASSNVDIFTFDEYNSGIRYKRFVVDIGSSYRRPNFITIQSDYGGNLFYGYTILIERSVDNSTWTTACSTQTQPNNSSRILAFNLGDLFDVRYIRFTFGASQAITSGGVLKINCIRSYSNQNYSSEIPVFTDSSANLYSKNSNFLATASGSVGIGITSPITKLHVYSPVAGAGSERTTPIDVLTLESENTTAQEFTGFGQAIVFRGSTYNNNTRRTLGKILHQINDDSVSTTRGTSLDFQLLTDATGSTLASRMYIKYDGNVGIGTNSPTQVLDVRGNIKLGADNEGNYIYYVRDNEGTIIRTARSDVTQVGLFRSDGWGNFTVDKSIGIGYSLGTGFASSTIGNGNLYVAGNVGIGTTSPVTKLHVEQVQNAESLITLRNNRQDLADVPIFGISAQNNITNVAKISFYRGGGGNSGYLTFSTKFDNASSLTEKVRIDGAGNVGIGTTNPASRLQIGNLTATQTSATETLSLGGTYSNTAGSNIKLKVYEDGGGGAIGGMSVSSGQMEVNTWTAGKIAFYRGTTQTAIIDASGNVGIGTTSPADKLEVDGGVRLRSGNSLTLRNATNDSSAAIYNVGGSNGSIISFAVGPTPTMYVGSNVGIGTISPTQKLDIVGSYAAAGDSSGILKIRGGATGADTQLNFGVSADGGYGWIQGTDVGATNNININLNPLGGNVGIGNTSPNNKLAVSGSVSIGSGYNTAAPTNGLIVEGSVGIGTTNPNRKLTVYGDGTLLSLQSPSASQYSEIEFTANGVGSAYIFKASAGYTNYGGAGAFNIYNAGPIAFHSSSNNNTVYIQANGNVGIGTISPASKLSIAGSSATNFKSLILRNGDGTVGSTVSIDLETSAGTIGDEASMAARISGIRLGGGTTGGLIFSTTNNGTLGERVRIINNGNVGIGTSIPVGKFDVRPDSSWIQAEAFIVDTDGGNNPRIRLYRPDGVSATTAYPIHIRNDSGNLNILTGAAAALGSETVTSKFYFTAAGNLGIGTTTPSSKLHISNAAAATRITITDDVANGRSGYIESNYSDALVIGTTSGVRSIRFAPDNSIAMTIAVSTNNVGIGALSPNNKLAVSGSVSIGSNYNTAAPTNGLIVEGSVGIGVTSPDANAKLHVYGNDAHKYIFYTDTAGSSSTIFQRNNTVESVVLTLANTRGPSVGTDRGTSLNLDLGYGGSSASAGTLARGAKISAFSSTSYTSTASTQNAYLAFYTALAGSLTEKMRIDSNGNVGIGTVSPSTTLHVNSTTSGATLLRADGTNGTLFSVVDDLSDSLMSVNNSAGLPVLEVFADDRVVMGQYGQNDFVLVNNKLGLGTNNPAYKLDINGTLNVSGTASLSTVSITGTINSSATEAIRINNNNGFISFYNSAASTRTGYLQGNAGNSVLLASENNALLQFAVGGTVRVTINTSGDVGIGTTSFAYSNANRANLEMYGSGESLLALRNSTGNSYIQKSGADFYINNTTNGFIAISNNGSERWRITNAGVFESNNAQTIRTSTGNLTLATNAGDGHIILSPHSNGNVGIGVAAPSVKLEVQGNGQFGNDSVTSVGLRLTRLIGGTRTSEHTFHSASNSPWYTYGQNLTWTGELAGTVESSHAYRPYFEGFAPIAGYKIFGFMNVNTGSFTSANIINALVIKNDGNVGIGTTSPAAKLDVVSSPTAIGTIIRVRDTVTLGTESFAGIHFTSSPGTDYTIGKLTTAAGAGLLQIRDQSGNQFVTINSSGNVGIGITNPAYKLDVNGATRFGGIVYNEAVQTDNFNYFNLQPYIESETLSTILSFGGAAPTFLTLTNTTAPFSKVMSVSAYGEAALGDYIPVQAGETIYGEIWAYRATGAVGTAGVLYCGVMRYDKDKKMIDSNAGLNTAPSGYFIAFNQTIPSNSTWTKYSGTLVLPTSHTPYNTSDGGPVRYIRPYIIYNYTAGTILTYIGGWKIRKVELTRDAGPVAVNGSVAIGSNSVNYGRLQISAATTTPNLSTTNPTDVSLIISNSDVAYGTMFATYGDGKGALQQRRTNAATYYDFILQPHGGNVGIATTSPSQKLEVQGNVKLNSVFGEGSTTGVTAFTHTTDSTQPSIYLWGKDHATYPGQVHIIGRSDNASANAGKIGFYDYNGTGWDLNMVINKNGNVGIGINDPSTKLDVAGEIRMPVIKQSTTLYAGTDITDDDSTRTVYFNIPAGGYSPPKYFKVARIKITANYQNVSLNGYFTVTNSIGLHVGSERKVEFDFIAYAATNPGAPTVTYLKRGPDTTTVLVYAVPNGGGAGTTYYDVYIRSAWYNDTNGELAVRVGYSSAVTIWQTGLDSGTSAPTDTLINPNSNYSFDTTGYVGIGTTNPTNRLHIYSSANEPVLIQGTTGGTWLNFQSSTSNLWSIGAINVTGFGIYNRTTNANTLFVANNGNIGVGNIYTSNNKLHVDGSMSVGSGYNTAAPTDGLIIQGSVGIGVTSASNTKLHVVADWVSGHSTVKIQTITSFASGGTTGIGLYDSNGTRSGYLYAYSTGTSVGSSNATPLIFETNGTEKMRILSGGNVGIGITAPTSKLNVLSSTSLSSVFKAEGINGTLFEVTDDLSNSLMSVNTIGGLPVFEVFANNTIIAGQYGANDFVINGNKVGVGTANPSFKLDVTGSFGLNAGANDGNWPFLVVDTSSSGGTNRYALNKIGAMGFNNADNYAQLQLVGSSGAYIDFANAAVDDFDARIIYYSNSRFDIQYGTVMTINSTGVGIGTTNPGYKLDVNGSFRTVAGNLTLFNDYIYVSPTNANTLNSAYNTNGIADMWVNFRGYQDLQTQFRNFNVGDGKGGNIAWFDGTNKRMSLNNGQAASYTLHVNGTAYINSTLQVNSNITLSGGGDVIINDSDGTGFFASFMDSGVGYIRIDDGGTANGTLNINSGTLFVGPSSGNVGIGTVTPGYKLDVNGNGRVGDAFYVTTATTGDAKIEIGNGRSGNGNSYIDLVGDATYTDYGLRLIRSNGGPNTTSAIAHRGTGTLYITAVEAASIALETSNTTRVTINSSGNVGIGTTSPVAKLDTLGVRLGRDFSLANRATVRLDANGAAFPSDILFGHTTTANQDGWNGVYWSLSSRGTANSNRFYFYRGSGNPAPNNSEAVIMSFDPTLNVGIGFEAPTNRLSIAGSTSIGSGYNTAGPTNGLIVEGSVGIGLTNPSYKFHVSGEIYSSTYINAATYFQTNTGQIRSDTSMALLTTGGSAQGVSIRGILLGTSYDTTPNANEIRTTNNTSLFLNARGTGDIQFQTADSTKIILLNNGNAGIGTIVPAARLHVNSTTSGATLLRADGTNGTLFSVVDDLSDSLMSVNNSAGLPVLEVFADDRVVAGQYGANDFVLVNNKLGLGTNNPQYELDIVGPGTNAAVNIITRIRSTAGSDIFNTASVIAFTNTTTNVNAYSYIGSRIDLGSAGDNAQALVFATNATNTLPTEKMRIKSDGNVGIGTNSPVGKLDVRAGSGGEIIFGTYDANYVVKIQSGDQLNFYNGASPNPGYINYGGGATVLSQNLHVEKATGGTTGLVRIKADGKVGIGTTAPATLLQVGTGTPTASTSGIQFGDDTSARIYRDSSTIIKVTGGFQSVTYIQAGNYLQTVGNLIYPAGFSSTQRLEVGNAAQNAWITGISIAPGGNVVIAGYLNAGGQTLNGQSFYQWEGATYRNPADHTPQFLLREDNSSTGINGFAPALALYNNNGGNQTTVGMVFVSAEAVSPTQGNAVNLAGIIAKKESAGTAGAWSRGSLNFFVKDFGTKVDALTIQYTGNVGIGTSNPATLLQVGTGSPTAATGGIQFGDDTGARIYRVSSSTIQVSNNLTVGGTLTESSSIRYKENIKTISALILPKLEAIRPITYNKKDNPNNIEYGIIAEELNDLFPEFVNKNDKGEVESVNYSRLTVLLIKAVKELKQEIEILKNK